jgi:hypothetical protein
MRTRQHELAGLRGAAPPGRLEIARDGPRRLTLTMLEMRGEASESDLFRPEPQSIVSVRVDGGARGVHLDRSAGSVARLHTAGGERTLTFDERRIGPIGGGTRLASAGADQAADRYESEIRGGASALTTGRWGDGGDAR